MGNVQLSCNIQLPVLGQLFYLQNFIIQAIMADICLVI